MNRPTLRLAAFVLLLAGGSAFAVDEKPPCDGGYKPEYAQLGYDEAHWSSLCASAREEPGAPQARRKDPAARPVSAAEGSARTALETGDFNGLYDNGLAGGGSAGAVLAPSRPALTAGHLDGSAPNVRGQPEPSVADPPLDPKQVEAHFHYEPPDSWLSHLGFIGRWLDKHVVKPIRSLFGGEEKAYVKSMTDKLQESAEGRGIMRGIIGEGVYVSIQPTDFPGSPAVKHGDVEEINGTRGMATWGDDTYRFNKNFMKMDDKEGALEQAASNMGHELNHLLLHTRVHKRLGKYDDVLDFALVDEQSARLKGYVVAWELNRGRPNGYIEDARQVLKDPDAYWEAMKLWMPAYARALDLDEMKDPVRAYQGRLQALTDRLDQLREEGPGIDLDLARLDHMAKAHGYASQLAEITRDMRSDKSTLPTRIQDARESIDVVKERIGYLQSKEGKAFAGTIKQAAGDADFVRLFGDMQGDLTKLKAYQAAKPVAKRKATPGQLDWDQFEKLWNQLHVNMAGQSPPWKER